MNLAFVKTGLSFLRDSARIRLGRRPVKPFVTGVTINTVCNLRCSYCFIGRESEHFPEGFAKQGLQADEIRKILENIRKDSAFLILTGGEPFLHRDLEEILRYAKEELRFVNISVATNGLFLKKRRSALRFIDRLGISYDFTRAKEYPKEMARMLESLVELKKERILPPVHFTMTVLRDESLEPLEEFAKFCRTNAFRIWMQPERDHGDFREWEWFIALVRDLKRKFGEDLFLNDLRIVESFARSKNGPACFPELRLHVNEDGRLCYPCNRLEHLYPAGSVLDATPMARWDEAVTAHGAFPKKECDGCGFTCYFETAGLYARPHSFLVRAVRHLRSSGRKDREESALVHTGQ